MSVPYEVLDIRMANYKVLLQPAYVLHQRAYRDTSVLLELFTPGHGRVGVVARGAKSIKSAWRGVLQPFQPLLVSWHLRSELGTLVAAEAQGPALTLAPEFIASGFYLNEIIMRLVDRLEGQLELFGCYDAALREMAGISTKADDKFIQLETLLRKFEIQLLAALGYGLVLDKDVNSGLQLQPGKQYVYYMDQGPRLVLDSDVESMEGIETKSQSISGKTLIAMRENDFSNEETRTQSKRLLRSILGYYLGPKPLKSRDLALSINRIH